MTVVYIDSLFLLNLVVNYTPSPLGGPALGEIIHRPRMALGAALGGVYAAAVFFPGMGFLLPSHMQAGRRGGDAPVRL